MPRAANPTRRNRRVANNPRNADRPERRQNRQEAQARRASARRGAQTRATNQNRQRNANARVPWGNVSQNPRVGSDYDPNVRRSDTVRGNRGKVPWGTEPAERSESLGQLARNMISRGGTNLTLKTIKVEDNMGNTVKQRALVGETRGGQPMHTLVSERDFRRFKAEARDGDGKIKVRISKG